MKSSSSAKVWQIVYVIFTLGLNFSILAAYSSTLGEIIVDTSLSDWLLMIGFIFYLVSIVWSLIKRRTLVLIISSVSFFQLIISLAVLMPLGEFISELCD